ncbi:MAG: hypothetical protein RLZZ611_143 [Cyanobacteriota bacterium]
MNQSSADGGNIPVHVANLNKARGSAPALAAPGLEPGSATVTAVHTPAGVDAAAALRHLELLGKDPTQAWFRSLPHGRGGANGRRKGADLQGFNAAELGADSAAGQALYLVVGNASRASGKNKKTGKITGCVEDSDIESVPALFVEWDEGELADQLTAWQRLELPEPTVMLTTGGKSAHVYWRLRELVSADEWKLATARLIAHCQSDSKCSNPSRVMRLAGSPYICKKTGKATGTRAEIVHEAPEALYDLAEILACLPAPEPAPAAPAAAPAASSRKTGKGASSRTRTLPPRSLAEIEAAAALIPERVVGETTYEQSRRALCGCAAALAEIGLPEERALDLLAHKWPDRATAEQALLSSTTRESKSFWAIAQAHGWDASRPDLRGPALQPPDGIAAEQLPWGEGPEAQPHTPPESFSELIERLPKGWDPDTLKPKQLSAGQLAKQLPAAQLRFNEMALRAEVQTLSGWQQITDADLDSAYVLLTGMGWKVGSEPVTKAILHTARQTPHHPVRAYLERVEDDPSIEPFNLDQLAPRFFRAADPLHVAMARAWLIGAVSRVFAPGCQMDYVLVLKGAQGQRKSRSLEALASPDWYCSSIPENEKDLLLNIHSCWLYELAEVESVTSRKEAGRLKNLITTSADLVRVPYGRTSERMPRQSVFCATCNEDTFLRDDTGSRRFWVVPVEGDEPLDRDGLIAARDAIWKAAVIAYRSGELPMLAPELERLSEQQNQEFNQQDAWVEMVRAWMDGDPMHRWDPDRDPSTTRYDPATPFTSAEVLYSAGLRRPDQITRADEMRVATVLRQLGFKKGRQQRMDGRVARPWELSQPSQPSQPQVTEVVTPQTVCAGKDLGLPSQPSQPFSTKRRVREEQAGGEAAGGGARNYEDTFEKSPRGCDTSPGSTAAQSVCLSQPQVPEVVTPAQIRPIPPDSPTWGADLLALKAEHPDHLPAQLANLLQARHGVSTTGKAVKEFLQEVAA